MTSRHQGGNNCTWAWRAFRRIMFKMSARTFICLVFMVVRFVCCKGGETSKNIFRTRVMIPRSIIFLFSKTWRCIRDRRTKAAGLFFKNRWEHHRDWSCRDNQNDRFPKRFPRVGTRSFVRFRALASSFDAQTVSLEVTDGLRCNDYFNDLFQLYRRRPRLSNTVWIYNF